MPNKTVVVIIGPTASGKSKLALDISKKLNGEVVSADSMQIYKKMNIGTAKPTEKELSEIPHHLIDIIEPCENYSLENFLKDCEASVSDILARGKLPIIAGGTGLYISSFINGIQLTEAKSDEKYRAFLTQTAENFGNIVLKQLLYEIDKTAYSKLKTNDRKRLIRALEIYRTTGKNPTQINNESKCDSKYNFIIFGLNASDRNFIYNQIDNRVDEMMKTGLEEEARYLYNTKLSNTACQAIGYKELFEYFDGKTSLDEAVSKLKQSSRNYAKRQITWFKKEKNVHWFDIDKKNYEEIMKNTIDGIVKCLNI